ncbi:MAG: hypothetical protein JWM21_1084 [Acidobacteria bacterium]|nr:hypothetical protein [Acidobacteriota bacterium]
MRGHMKLVHALIGKSIAETILVAVLAVSFYLSAFPPSFHGWGEVQPHSIAGWAVNQADPWERLEVQLFIDGKFVTSGTANQSRPDVAAAGWASDEWHGFKFDLSLGPGRHQARVYALHANRRAAQQTLQMVGDPIMFDVAVDGALHPLSDKSF